MVDFNSEGAFTSNKGHILELLILGRRDEMINTFQLWKEAQVSSSSKQESYLHKIHSIMFAIFLETREAFKRKLKDNFSTLETLILDKSIDSEKAMICFIMINECLDELGLTKIDNKKRYDSRVIEEENKEKGL
jgi:hypothetical protein